MGFLDYAWLVSLQKDRRDTRILLDSSLNQPLLEQDDFGFTLRFPKIRFLSNGQMVFLGEKFAQNSAEKAKLGRLFRASILHLTAHTVAPLPKELIFANSSDSIPVAFVKSLVRDICANAYIRTWHSDSCYDISYANAMAYKRVKSSERIFSSSTRIMADVLFRINVGQAKGFLEPEEQQAANAIYREMAATKEAFLTLFSGKKISLTELLSEKTKNAAKLLGSFGPFFEAPSLPYTEQIGRCSIFADAEPSTSLDFENAFENSVEILGGSIPTDGSVESCWRKEQEVEALQAFDSEKHEEERREKSLLKIAPYVGETKFKSASFPEEDYSRYLRAKTLVQGASRRLLDVLRAALDYLDEDPRQEMGQLDLNIVIQAMASNKPATDVFMLDQYLKQSFAWSIVLDVSGSMKVRGEYARALAIAVAEAAKELMTDPTSWTFFGFSDRFYILKDNAESYSQRVRARIGGLKFEGLTYIPDAMYIAGKMLAKRFEEQRVLVVISDGWPYGYDKMPAELKNNVDDLLRKGVIVIGIGVETDRMSKFFRLNSSIYSPKDFVKKFGTVFNNASEKALET